MPIHRFIITEDIVKKSKKHQLYCWLSIFKAGKTRVISKDSTDNYLKLSNSFCTAPCEGCGLGRVSACR